MQINVVETEIIDHTAIYVDSMDIPPMIANTITNQKIILYQEKEDMGGKENNSQKHKITRN